MTTFASLLSAAFLCAAPDPPPADSPPSRRVLSIDEALELAWQHQPQLQQARAASTASAARADQARAALLPQLFGSAAYQRTTGNVPPRAGASTTTSWTTFDYWTMGATASQLVFDFGQAPGRWKAAKATAESLRESEQATRLQVALLVRTSYFSARAARELVTVAHDTQANLEAHLRQIEGFVRAGTRPTIDLAKARTDVASAEVQTILAENGYETARLQLDQAMGLEEPFEYDVGDDTLPPLRGEDDGLGALLPEGLDHRPDVRATAQAIKAEELTLGSLSGAYFPSLGVSTGVTDVGPSLGAAVPNWNATATLTWSLFQGGLVDAQQSEARATAEGLGAQLATVRQQVRLDVEQSRLSVRAARSALRATDRALENARELLRLAEARYRTGVGSVIELGDAQVALTSAAAQAVQARFILATSRAQLLHALGRAGVGD
jgi:outer membrane protein